MNALVIGYGSIGQRHVNILNNYFNVVGVISKQEINKKNVYSDIEVGLQQLQPSYVVIANPTYLHQETLDILEELEYRGKILVEKPLFHEYKHKEYSNKKIYIGYNLRFHPMLVKIKDMISSEEIESAYINTGQYLPLWRPNTDYTKCYSAKREQGGGVLRDLSHELDYASWLFGNWNSLVSLSNKVSKLDINSEDCCSVIMETKKCKHLLIHINYLNRTTKREIVINTKNGTIKGDLIKGELIYNNSTETFKLDRNDTYIEMHEAIINNIYDRVCDYKQGINVMRLIDGIEKSSLQRKWVYNE